jgi:hypothetical protein
MDVLIVMIVLITGGSPTTIPGWHSLAACNAAKEMVDTAFKKRHGATSYVDIEINCVEFPNKS